MLRVCFVCLGNICRSPTAEGVFLHLVTQQGLADRFVIDSAGTAGYHVGELPDARSRAAASRRGYRLPSRSRQFVASDFADFDWVLAMDRANQRELLRLARTPTERAKVRLLRSFELTALKDAEVPDPYYGGESGFDEVLDICERACGSLLKELSPGL